MADKLTDQQQAVVDNRGGNLLVSAAAGSGKTKVLVERLMKYITDTADPSNIDDFLIITYTKAAAAELRAKISAAMTARIAQNPADRRLQQQLSRLYMAKISTVHAFCTDVLREYAYMLDIPGDFRMIEEREDAPLREQVLAQVLESAYAGIAEDPEFSCFVDTQGVGRDDRLLPELILKIYDSAKCHLAPNRWLSDCVDRCSVEGLTDGGQTIWGKYLIGHLLSTAESYRAAMHNVVLLCEKANGQEKLTTLLKTIENDLMDLLKCKTWDEIHSFRGIDFGDLRGVARSKSKDPEVYEAATALRKRCMDALTDRLADFGNNSKKVLSDLAAVEGATRGLIKIVQRFSQHYSQVKKNMRVMDFSDLEHKTLDLLLGSSRQAPTAVAKALGNQFREIMVDEYQDSNEVQDAIFTALTQGRGNLFVVGDVKQSIYQFRLADPGIFLKKYEQYAFAGHEAPGCGRKLVLSNNFRSGMEVIEAVNAVFAGCMSKRVGGLVYGPEETLVEGIKKGPLPETAVELHTLEVTADRYAEEAEFVAGRIVELLDGSHVIREGESFRPIQPEDIVILLRSANKDGYIFADALRTRGIRTVSNKSVDLLKTDHVQWLCSLLQTINNPRLDISLAAAMCGPVFGVDADALAKIRGKNTGITLYESVCRSEEPLAVRFVTILNQLRSAAAVTSLPELIEKIFLLTKADCVYSAMPDGAGRQSELYEFYQFVVDFCAGMGGDLTKLLTYLEQSQKDGISAKSPGSAKGCVQICSIHKSKGLEYPVVFLCTCAKGFNLTDTHKTILADKELGLGLSCIEKDGRIRYPSIARRAICRKMVDNTVSEQLRLLYVAMTRPKDRLIMVHAQKKVDEYVFKTGVAMDLMPREQQVAEAGSMGDWIMLSALKRTEAGQLFDMGYKPRESAVSKIPWLITYHDALPKTEVPLCCEDAAERPSLAPELAQLKSSLEFRYPYEAVTKLPSKQTATQRKGRIKDQEAAENSAVNTRRYRSWREPSFVSEYNDPAARGVAMHTAIKYLQLSACATGQQLEEQLDKMVQNGILTEDQARLVDIGQLLTFFASDLGKRLVDAKQVLREFKFSVLEDAAQYSPQAVGESILLQGVIDCAIIEPEGITVIDFKTDRITEDTSLAAIEKYRGQVETYAQALGRIFEKPVKERLLYFFAIGKALAV